MNSRQYNSDYGAYPGTYGFAHRQQRQHGLGPMNQRMYPQAAYRNYMNYPGYSPAFVHPLHNANMWYQQGAWPRGNDANARGNSGAAQREAIGLHPILDCDGVNRLFDIRQPPQWSLQDEFWKARHDTAVQGERCRSIRLVSREFPWTIDIFPFTRSHVQYVTCGDILHGLHAFFDQNMNSLDWRFVLTLEDKIQTAVKATIESRSRGSGRPAKRVDWLVKKVFFRGLVKDDEFAKSLLPSGQPFYPHTFVVKLVDSNERIGIISHSQFGPKCPKQKSPLAKPPTGCDTCNTNVEETKAIEAIEVSKYTIRWYRT